jgi:hypothetical protein
MFRKMLLVQWKWSRAALLAICVLVAMVPALTMRMTLYDFVNQTPRDLVTLCSALGLGLSFLAILTGIALQDAAWRQDVNGKYVYALSLPVPWNQFVVRRLACGLLLLLLPALFLWFGGWLATTLITLPPTLQTYAGGVAVRFFLASALSYAAWGVLVRFSGERSSLVMLVILLAVLVVPIAVSVSGVTLPTDSILRFIADPPGPLSVFFSRWAIIDV